MEILAWIWVLSGVGHFVYDWFLGEHSLKEYKDSMSVFEFFLNLLFQLSLAIIGGTAWFAYTLYKAWKDNQPFTAD